MAWDGAFGNRASKTSRAQRRIPCPRTCSAETPRKRGLARIPQRAPEPASPSPESVPVPVSPGASRELLLVEQAIEHGGELRQFRLNEIPDQAVVDVRVAMDENVPEGDQTRELRNTRPGPRIDS